MIGRYAAKLVSQDIQVAFQRVVVQGFGIGEQYLDGHEPRGICRQGDRPGCAAHCAASWLVELHAMRARRKNSSLSIW